MNVENGTTRVYDSLECIVLQLDEERNVWFLNRFGLRLLGYERLGQIFGKPLCTLLPGDDAQSARLEAGLEKLENADRLPQFECELLHRDGTRIPVAFNIVRRGEPGESIAPFFLLGLDLAAVRQNRDTAVLFQAVAANYTQGIVITDCDTNILYANPAALRMSGYSADELLGRQPSIFKSGQTPDDVYQNLWQTLDAGEIWRGELVNCRKNGERFLERQTISAIRDASNRVQYYFSIGDDLTERQQYQQRIDQLASFDQLTGLPNRATLLRALLATLEEARLRGSEAAVLHVDIDEFFKVNDSLGADDADRILAETGKRLQGILRQNDLVARLGDDKFAIVLGLQTSGIEADSVEIAERVLKAMRQPFVLASHRLDITASVGIACFPGDGDNAHGLLNHAISATQQAKDRGGNAACRFEAAMAAAESGRRALLGELRQASERNEFRLFFQPQLSLLSGEIIGLEALIRWQHPLRGLVSPGDFIPFAEENGHIVDIDEWVLNEACRQMRAWLDDDLPPVKVAVNLSARHFRLPSLPSTIAGALSAYRLDPRFLEIEITEGAMMQDVAAAIRSTQHLKELGVRLSLDDFGTGYSSLAYLSHFPIDVVKIDQSFVKNITTHPVNAAIAQATIAMSHKLGKVALAEGVETEEQMLYLQRSDCDEMQGYFFSPPCPADDIARMLREGRKLAFSRQGTGEARSIVLLVDDEENILSALKRTLRREGYDILTATSANEGLSLLARHRVQVIVSDQRMPEMTGTEFLARVKSLHPETVRMVLSGYSEISAVTDAINRGAVYRFLSKPWDDEEVKEEIRGALRHWRELYAPYAPPAHNSGELRD